MKPHEFYVVVQGLQTSDGKQRPRRTLLQLVIAVRLELRRVGSRCWCVRFGVRGAKDETLPFFDWIAYLKEDIIRRAVWVGRYPAEKISAGPNGQLIRVGNPE